MKHLYELETDITINLSKNKNIEVATIGSELMYDEQITPLREGTYSDWKLLVDLLLAEEKESPFVKGKYITVTNSDYEEWNIAKNNFKDFTLRCRIIEYPKDKTIPLDYVKRTLSFDKYIELIHDMFNDLSEVDLLKNGKL